MSVPCRVPILALMALAATATGCHREFYRRQADRDVQCLVQQKSADPRWGLPGFTIQQDPRSRYFDSYSLDRPPMPEDDPISHRYMHCVDGMRGWPHWGRDGFRESLDNPQWRQRLPEYVQVNSRGEIKLDLPTALRWPT